MSIDNGKSNNLNCESISYEDSLHDVMKEVEDSSFWFSHRNKIIIEVLKKYMNFDLIYDVGGGNGYVAKEMLANGYNVSMIEPGGKGVENALLRGVKNVYRSTIEEMNFQDKSIDAFSFFDVIEHIDNDGKFLKYINSKLKDSGEIVFTVPAKKKLWSQEDIIAGHYRRYEMFDLQVLLESCGFEIKYSTFFFEYLVYPIFILRKLKSMIMGGKYKDNYSQNTINTHNSENFFVKKVLDYFNNKELDKVKSGNCLTNGSSIIIVATKK